MQIVPGTPYAFDRFMPMYNWLYPVAPGRAAGAPAVPEALRSLTQIKSRALYVHIPFCDTVCSFCPFVRTAGHGGREVQRYLDALRREIELKAEMLPPAPIRAIFFGGGTPSVLTGDQIRQLGASLHGQFDLSALEEFSFEFEVKTVSRETVEAAREIGVTHARFGLQTLNPRFRKLFALSSTIDQVRGAARTLKESFQTVSCDLMYGMHGQTPDEILDDIDGVAALGLPNLDAYPINNVAVQPKLLASYRREGLLPHSGLSKHYMNLMVRSALRERGYLPHNGHGYVLAAPGELRGDPVVTRTYSFVYHEHVYGYQDHDFIGFGVNAVSSSQGWGIVNPASRSKYVEALEAGAVTGTPTPHDPAIDAVRPVALKLPYQGSIATDRVLWDAVPDEVSMRLEQLIAEGLVENGGDEFRLTRRGWSLYANLMYFLSPQSERAALGQYIRRRQESFSDDLGEMRVQLAAVA